MSIRSHTIFKKNKTSLLVIWMKSSQLVVVSIFSTTYVGFRGKIKIIIVKALLFFQISRSVGKE